MYRYQLLQIYQMCLNGTTRLMGRRADTTRQMRHGQETVRGGLVRRTEKLREPTMSFQVDDDEEAEELLNQLEQTGGINMREVSNSDHVRDRKWLKNKILERKYFKQDPEANLLLWSAKAQIKFLHEEAPEEWTTERLAESFPISCEGVVRLLHSKWAPESEEEILRHDLRVYRQWQSLTEMAEDKSGPINPLLQQLLQSKTLAKMRNATGSIDLPVPKEKIFPPPIRPALTGPFSSILSRSGFKSSVSVPTRKVNIQEAQTLLQKLCNLQVTHNTFGISEQNGIKETGHSKLKETSSNKRSSGTSQRSFQNDEEKGVRFEDLASTTSIRRKISPKSFRNAEDDDIQFEGESSRTLQKKSFQNDKGKRRRFENQFFGTSQRKIASMKSSQNDEEDGARWEEGSFGTLQRESFQNDEDRIIFERQSFKKSLRKKSFANGEQKVSSGENSTGMLQRNRKCLNSLENEVEVVTPSSLLHMQMQETYKLPIDEQLEGSELNAEAKKKTDFEGKRNK